MGSFRYLRGVRDRNICKPFEPRIERVDSIAVFGGRDIASGIYFCCRCMDIRSLAMKRCPFRSCLGRPTVACLILFCFFPVHGALAQSDESLRSALIGSWISELKPSSDEMPVAAYFTQVARTYNPDGTMSGWHIVRPGYLYVLSARGFSGVWRIADGKLFVLIVQPPQSRVYLRGEILIEAIVSCTQSEQVLRERDGSLVKFERWSRPPLLDPLRWHTRVNPSCRRARPPLRYLECVALLAPPRLPSS